MKKSRPKGTASREGRSERPGGRDGVAKRGGKPAEHRRAKRSDGDTRRGKNDRPGRTGDTDRSARPNRSGGPGRQDKSKRPGGLAGQGKPKRSGGSVRPAAGSRKSTARTAGRAERRPETSEEIRLNKYIAHAGLCSRRDADLLIEQGEVSVNGVRVTEHGVKVSPSDRIEVRGQRLTLEPFVYLLLNKAKDTISTTDDERGRNTVLDAVEEATGHRIYPVGRLDRDTTGLLLLTNDGDLTHRMMHPSYRVKKVYEATLNRPLTRDELRSLASGIELEDGPVTPHRLQVIGADASLLEITIQEGRNHLVRRMIGHIGAEVLKLKRTRYSGLTLKGVNVGRWRYLNRKEINDLRRSVKLDPLDVQNQAEQNR